MLRAMKMAISSSEQQLEEVPTESEMLHLSLMEKSTNLQRMTEPTIFIADLAVMRREYGII